MPLYCAISTRFGSIRISFTSVGVERISSEQMMALTHTLLPDPVAPAIRTCGILARSALNGWPATSWPSAKASLLVAPSVSKLSEPSTSLRVTRSKALFGISMPTYGSPGIGASIRIERAARPSARLSARPSIRDSLMPGSTSSAYWVTTGPSWMRATFTPIPKWASVSWIRLSLGGEVHLGGAAGRGVGEQVELRQLPDAFAGLEGGVDRVRLPHRGQVLLLLRLQRLHADRRHAGRHRGPDRGAPHGLGHGADRDGRLHPRLRRRRCRDSAHRRAGGARSAAAHPRPLRRRRRCGPAP